MDFDNNLDKLTKNEFVKSFGETIEKLYKHTEDKDVHVTNQERETWNNNSKLIPDYNGAGNSFFSLDARQKLANIEEHANRYIHPSNNLEPGRYLEVHFDQYGHANYVNNPSRINVKVKNAKMLNNTKSNGFLYTRGSNFPRNFNINTSYQNMVDRSAVNVEYLENMTLNKAFVIGPDEDIINSDEHNKIYINSETDTAYFYDGANWVPIGSNKAIHLDKDGYIPDKYIPDDISSNQPIGEIEMCLSKRPPKGWISLDGSLYFRKDLPDLWEYAQKNNLVVSDDEWKTLYKNKNGNTNYNIAAGLFSSGDGINTFRVPSFFGEPLYTSNIADVGKTRNFAVKQQSGLIPAYYDEAKQTNLAYNGITDVTNSNSSQIKTFLNTNHVPTIHPSRIEAAASGVFYDNIYKSTTNVTAPYDKKTSVSKFISVKPSMSVPVGNEFRPRQFTTNFIMKAVTNEDDFPDKLYKAKKINSNIDLSSYALDIYNHNIIYSNESIGEYVANHLYLKRFIFDMSHWKSGVVNFIDTQYALYTLLFSDVRVEFYDLTGIYSVTYPFNLEVNSEFLTELCVNNFVTEPPTIDHEIYSLYNDENEDSSLKERPVTQIINSSETSEITISLCPLFPTNTEKNNINLIEYQTPRTNTILDVKNIYGSIQDNLFNIEVSRN